MTKVDHGYDNDSMRCFSSSSGKTGVLVHNASHKRGSLDLDLLSPDPEFGDIFGELYGACRRGKGDDARVAWRVPEPGVVLILVVERGSLPKGAGGQLIAEALTQSNTLPTKRLVFEEIINQPTIDAYVDGSAPESTVLGKTATSALDQMGLSPNRCSWDVGPNKMRMVIDISAP